MAFLWVVQCGSLFYDCYGHDKQGIGNVLQGEGESQVEGACWRRPGYVIYTHSDTSNAGTTFNIGGSTTYQWTSRTIGYTRSTEAPGCPWEAPHLHQTDSGTGWTRNSSKYPAGGCPPPPNYCGTYPIGDLGHHQASHGWSYTF